MTPAVRQEFDRKLEQARCEWDTSFAAVLSAAPDRYEALIRGGPPNPQQWKAARAAAGRLDVISDQVLLDIFRAVLTGTSAGRAPDTTAIVLIDQDGIAVIDALADVAGSPLLRRTSDTRRWPDLLPFLAGDPGEQQFQLAGRTQGLDQARIDDSLRKAVPALTASRVLVVCRPATWQLPARAAKLTAAARASVPVVLASPADLPGGELPETAIIWAGTVADGTPASDLLGQAAASLPLSRAYYTVIAKLNAANGRISTEKVPVFQPGDQQGKAVTLPLRRLPGEDGTVSLAVLCGNGDDPDQVVAAVAVPLPKERQYRVTITLDGPGRLRFTEPPGVTPDARPWDQTLASVPARVSVPSGPLDLVCAIELGGAPALVRQRRKLVGELLSLIEAEYPDPEHVKVSVIGCVDHIFRRGFERTPVVRGEALAPLPEARRTLNALKGSEITTDDATAIEDLLQEAVVQLSASKPQGRATRLLVVADRPPHPYPQTFEVVACPEHISWTVQLGELIGTHGVWCVAVTTKLPADRQLATIWQRLGNRGLHESGTSVRRIGEDLGLLARNSQRITIPLADW